MLNLVTICIPVYNGSSYIRAALDSAISQSYKNIEILIVDDGSTDGSDIIAEAYCKQDNRIRFVKNSTNLGLVGNWQKCIEESRGNWIKFLFQDDYMTSSCVEVMHKACIDHDVMISICSRNLLIEQNSDADARGHFENKIVMLNTLLPESCRISCNQMADIGKQYMFSNIIGEPIVLFFKKEIISHIGNYNADLVQLVDYEFALRACLNFDSYFINQSLVTFRVHMDATSNRAKLNATKMMKREFLEPLIMYHEYLFNKNFYLLRSKVSKLKLYIDAAKFYGAFIYKYKDQQLIISDILKKYKHMDYIKFFSGFWSIKRFFKLPG